MNLRPRNRQVIIRPAWADRVGAVLLPGVAQQMPSEGVALAVGRDVVDVQEGHRVIVEKWLGTEIDLGGERLWFVDEAHILAVIEP